MLSLVKGLLNAGRGGGVHNDPLDVYACRAGGAYGVSILGKTLFVARHKDDEEGETGLGEEGGDTLAYAWAGSDDYEGAGVGRQCDR